MGAAAWINSILLNWTNQMQGDHDPTYGMLRDRQISIDFFIDRK